jgi:hypothetical protein
VFALVNDPNLAKQLIEINTAFVMAAMNTRHAQAQASPSELRKKLNPAYEILEQILVDCGEIKVPANSMYELSLAFRTPTGCFYASFSYDEHGEKKRCTIFLYPSDGLTIDERERAKFVRTIDNTRL